MLPIHHAIFKITLVISILKLDLEEQVRIIDIK